MGALVRIDPGAFLWVWIGGESSKSMPTTRHVNKTIDVFVCGDYTPCCYAFPNPPHQERFIRNDSERSDIQ